MPHRPPATPRRWQATLILLLFGVAVSAAAFIGWWSARESPPHRGPIILVSAHGLRADRVSAYGATGTATPALDEMAADSVLFDRAYTHSTQSLPAHASILSGQLPFEHGVRDDAGFVVKDASRMMAELLRSRGFETAAAVSSFLLRRDTGLSQGFSFFDADLPAVLDDGARPERDSSDTLKVATDWMRQRSDQRYFLFLEVAGDAVDEAVGGVADELRRRDLYEDATIIVTADRGDERSPSVLDDASIRVPMIVKQPNGTGAGRRVQQAVQHVDLLPTLLDLVRAPIPSGLRGRSLRPILDDDDAGVVDQPIYSESLESYFRFGGHPVFAATGGARRVVRSTADQVLTIGPQAAADPAAADALKAWLDRLLSGRAIGAPSPVRAADVDRLAGAGYVAGLRTPADPVPMEPAEEASIAATHRQAVRLVAEKRFAAAIDILRALAARRPDLAAVHFQLGSLLVRTGRIDEGMKALEAAGAARPDAPEVPTAVAAALLRGRHGEEAGPEADRAVALATSKDAEARAAAHEIATRAALARSDRDAAIAHAAEVETADSARPMGLFVKGRTLFDDERFEDARVAFEQAAAVLEPRGLSLAELHSSLGDTLARLDRYDEAEARYREELRDFPHDIRPYSSLAMLYRASNREGAVEDVIGDLIEAAPTPEGYSAAAQLWTIVGDRKRAEAIRADARRRFRGDPSLALLGR